MRRSVVIAKQAGDKLRTWCEDRGLMSLVDVADVADVSVPSVGHAYGGRASLWRYVQICEAIGYDIEELISFTKEERAGWPPLEDKEKSR